jgi:hypothetical protein
MLKRCWAVDVASRRKVAERYPFATKSQQLIAVVFPWMYQAWTSSIAGMLSILVAGVISNEITFVEIALGVGAAVAVLTLPLVYVSTVTHKLERRRRDAWRGLLRPVDQVLASLEDLLEESEQVRDQRQLYDFLLQRDRILSKS